MVINPPNTPVEGLFGFMPVEGGAALSAGTADFTSIIMQLMGGDAVPINSENTEITGFQDIITTPLPGLSDSETSAVTSENEALNSVQARLIIHTPDGENISIPIFIDGSVPAGYGGLAVNRNSAEKQEISINSDETDSDSMVTPLAVFTHHEIPEIHTGLPSTPGNNPLYITLMTEERVEGVEPDAENDVLITASAHTITIGHEDNVSGISGEPETRSGTEKTVFPYLDKIITLQENGLHEAPESNIPQERKNYRSIHLITQADSVSSSPGKTGETAADSIQGILPHGIESTHSDYSVQREIPHSTERSMPVDVLRRGFNASEEINPETTDFVPLVTGDTAEYTHDGSEIVQAPQKAEVSPVIMVQTDGGEVPVVISTSGSSQNDSPVYAMLEELLASGAQVEIVFDTVADGEKVSLHAPRKSAVHDSNGENGSESVDKVNDIKQTETTISENNQKSSLKSETVDNRLSITDVTSSNTEITRKPTTVDNKLPITDVTSSNTEITRKPTGNAEKKYIEEYSSVKSNADFTAETDHSKKIIFNQSSSKWSSGGVGTVSNPADKHRTFTRTPVNPPGTITHGGDQDTAEQADYVEYTRRPSVPRGDGESEEGLPFKSINISEAFGQDGHTELTGRQVSPYKQNDSSSETPYVTSKTVGGTIETQETRRVDTELSTQGSHKSSSVSGIENPERADGIPSRTKNSVPPDMTNTTLAKQAVENTVNQGVTAETHLRSEYDTTVHKINSGWINGTGTGTGIVSSGYLYPGDTAKSGGASHDSVTAVGIGKVFDPEPVTVNRNIIVEDEHSTISKTPEKGDVKSVTESTNIEGSTKTETFTEKVRPQETQNHKIPLARHELSGEAFDRKGSLIHEESGNTNGAVKNSGEVSLSSSEVIVNKNDASTIPPVVKTELAKSSGAVTTGNTSNKETVFSPETEFSSSKPERVLAKHTVDPVEISESADTARSEFALKETPSDSTGRNVTGHGESRVHTKYPVTDDVSVTKNLSESTNAQTDKTPVIDDGREDASVPAGKQEYEAVNRNSIISNRTNQNSDHRTVEHIPAPVLEESVHHDPDLKPGKKSAEGSSNKEGPVIGKTGGGFIQTEGDSAFNSDGGQSEYQSRNFETIHFDNDLVYGGKGPDAQSGENQSYEITDKSSGITPSAGLQNESVLNPENVSGHFRISHENMTPGETENRLMNTIVRNARFMITGGQSSAEIKLEPPNLGRMKLEIVTENSKITGKITVESHEVKEMIQNSMSSLKEQLSESGLKVESFDVQVGHNSGFDSWAHREHAENLKQYVHRNITGYENTSEDKTPVTGDLKRSKSVDSDYLDVLV